MLDSKWSSTFNYVQQFELKNTCCELGVAQMNWMIVWNFFFFSFYYLCFMSFLTTQSAVYLTFVRISLLGIGYRSRRISRERWIARNGSWRGVGSYCVGHVYFREEGVKRWWTGFPNSFPRQPNFPNTPLYWNFWNFMLFRWILQRKATQTRDFGLAIYWSTWEDLGEVIGVKSTNWPVWKVLVRQVLGGVIGYTLVTSDTKKRSINQSRRSS